MYKTVGYILGVARYTDATVRYVPRFDTISVQQGKKNLLCSGSFPLFWTDSSAN